MARNKTPIAEKYNAPFPTALRKLMEERGETQENIAKAAEKTRQTISQYVNGISEPGYETLVKIADHFNVSADYLLGRTEDPHRQPCAIDELGISEKVINWFHTLKTLKKHGNCPNVNQVFENPFFQHIVYCISDYMNASKAEEIYEQLLDQHFDYEHVEYSSEEGRVQNEKFEAAILDIADSNIYGSTISTLLRANCQLWGYHTSTPDLAAIIAEKSGIANISAYSVNKYLVNLLDSLRETIKEEVRKEISAKAEG